MVGMMVKEMFMFVCQNCTVITIETTPTGEWIVALHSCTGSSPSFFCPHTPRCVDFFLPSHIYSCKITVVAFTEKMPTLASLRHHVMKMTTLILFLYLPCFPFFFSFFFLYISSSFLSVYLLPSFYDVRV